MIRIDVNIDTSDLEAAISRLREKAQDTTPIMRRCADVLAGAAEGAFDDEADPVTGAKWQPLAASTAAAVPPRGIPAKYCSSPEVSPLRLSATLGAPTPSSAPPNPTRLPTSSGL